VFDCVYRLNTLETQRYEQYEYKHKNIACMFWVLDGKEITKVCPGFVRVLFYSGLQIFRVCAQYIIIVIVVSRYVEETLNSLFAYP
jgi:hypothetical protein